MKLWSYFGFLCLFLFCFVHLYWRNIPPPSSRGFNQFRWIYLEDGVSMFTWNVRTNQNTLCCRSPIGDHHLISNGEKIWKLADFKLNVHTQSTGNLNTVCRDYHALQSTLYFCSASRASNSLYKSSMSCLFVPGTKVCMYSCV
jgi:hypothetical protein